MLTVREFPVPAHEVMLDIENGRWVTVFVVARHALIQAPATNATERVLRGLEKQQEIVEYLVREFDVQHVMFPDLTERR